MLPETNKFDFELKAALNWWQDLSETNRFTYSRIYHPDKPYLYVNASILKIVAIWQREANG